MVDISRNIVYPERMNKSSMISLLTDFGSKDWFCAAVKGEIMKICPDCRVVDITNEVKPHDIRSAAFIISQAYRNFPRGTVHLCIVDPGVGGERKPIVVRTRDYYFVGPDNGIFSYIYELEKCQVFQITWKSKMSKTFQARDLFGPVAALILKGAKLNSLVKPLNRYSKFALPQPEIRSKIIRLKVLYIDNFGNMITNLRSTDLMNQKGHFLIKGKKVEIKNSYERVKKGDLLAIDGSTGFLEICRNQGNAALYLEAEPGMVINYVVVR